MKRKKKKEIVKRIAVNLNNPTSKKFETIKQHLNIDSDTDVVRFLIGWYHRTELKKRETEA